MTAFRRRVIRTISFRTDQPKWRVTGHDAPSRALRMGQGERMIVLTSITGRTIVAPIRECELGDTRVSDRMAVKVPGRSGKFVLDIEDARIGWQGVTSVMEPFERSQESQATEKDQKEVRNLHAKQLVGQIWRRHAGIRQ
ncbi:hypothetical protein CPB86DRAFT_789455 [Serendipita vermifera]|nr:hypothetical protein CPB86DRAFT_789455 [Serendipita vermifera]